VGQSAQPAVLRRVAAGATLVLLAGVTLVAIFLLFANLPLLFGAWIGMVLAIVAFSLELRASGGARVVWRVVMAGGVVVAVGSLVFLAISSPWGSVAALVALVGIAFLGSYALHAPAPIVAALSALNPVLLVNPKSGGGKATKANLAEIARERGIDVRVLGPDDDLREMALAAVAEGADAIGMAGGDGSLGLVAAVAIEASIPFICIPAGTRNHFARDLGLDRADLVGALDAFEGEVRVIDYATVNGRVYLNVASMGVYAETVSDPAYRDAKLETARDTLASLEDSGSGFDLRFTDEDGRQRRTADLIMVSSGRYQISGALFDIGKRARLDSGRLGVIVLEVADAATAVELATLSAAGLIDRYPGWTQWETLRFDVDSGAPIAIGIDGESVFMDPPLLFEIHAGDFAVAVPKGTPSGPRMSPLGSMGSIRRLWQTFRGVSPT